jgi:hypothetical protein
VYGEDEKRGFVVECKCGPGRSGPSSRLRTQLQELQAVESVSAGKVRYAFASYLTSYAARRNLNRALLGLTRIGRERVFGRENQHLLLDV